MRSKKYNRFLPVKWMNVIARIGDFLHLPLNSERLKKLTESYVVSNAKIKQALSKKFPRSGYSIVENQPPRAHYLVEVKQFRYYQRIQNIYSQIYLTGFRKPVRYKTIYPNIRQIHFIGVTSC